MYPADPLTEVWSKMFQVPKKGILLYLMNGISEEHTPFKDDQFKPFINSTGCL